jgi:hypothetical protein
MAQRSRAIFLLYEALDTRLSSGEEGLSQLEFGAVILSAVVLQAEGRIWRGASSLHARSLAPLVKARCFGMTTAVVVTSFQSVWPVLA